VALLEFLLAAARAGIVATDVLQRIAHRIMAVIAMRAVDVPVIMLVIVVMVAIGTVHMGFVVHRVATPE